MLSHLYPCWPRDLLSSSILYTAPSWTLHGYASGRSSSSPFDGVVNAEGARLVGSAVDIVLCVRQKLGVIWKSVASSPKWKLMKSDVVLRAKLVYGLGTEALAHGQMSRANASR